MINGILLCGENINACGCEIAGKDDVEGNGDGHKEGCRQRTPGVQMLYIQMEFCPRTLRQVLDEGSLEDEDAWQVY
jgi:hypothetical protein